MNFCKMCGKRLEKKAAAPPPAASSGPNKYGFAEGLPSPATVFNSQRNVPAPGGTAASPRPSAPAPPPQDAYAPTIAPSSVSELQAAIKAKSKDIGSATTAPGNSPTPYAANLAEASTMMQTTPPRHTPHGARGEQFGRLVVVNRDGTDGQAFPLHGEQVDVGRHEGDIVFENDRYLASRHARFDRQGSQVVIRAFDHVNGVFVRLTGNYSLRDRDLLILGKQVMRFDYLTPEERQTHQAVQHGVALFGTPARQPWGRLSQIDTSGVIRDVYHLARAEVVIGREEGDIRFPGDEFMSRRHAIFTHREGQASVADNGSSNGSYVKLVGERTLVPGDLIRMGDQLFRFERV